MTQPKNENHNIGERKTMNELFIPDALPVLSSGHHPVGSGNACVMDAVSWLMGKPEEGDAPSCVHPVLRSAAIRVNDALPDAERWRLWELVPHLIGTADERDDVRARKVLSVRLAVCSARQVLDLVPVKHRDVAEAAIAAAEGWCAGTVSEADCLKAASAYASAASAYASAASAYAYASAYAAASSAASAYAYASAYAAASAAASAAAYAYASAASASAYAAAAFGSLGFEFLKKLVAEHARLTGHTPRPVVQAEWDELTDMLGTVVR